MYVTYNLVNFPLFNDFESFTKFEQFIQSLTDAYRYGIVVKLFYSFFRLFEVKLFYVFLSLAQLA